MANYFDQYDATAPTNNGQTASAKNQNTGKNYFDQYDAPIPSLAADQNQSNASTPQLQPSNFFERLGMASAGDADQQTEVARQAALYSKNLAGGALNALDTPNQVLNTAVAIPGAATKFALDQFKSGTQPAFVEDLSSEIAKNGNAPPMGQQFENDYNKWTGNQIQPVDNTEKDIGAMLEMAPSGALFGGKALLGAALGGGAQQEMSNRGLSPDQSALLGIVTGGGVMNAPEDIANMGKSISNGTGNIIRGLPGINQDALKATYEQMQSQYTPAMQAAKNVPLTDDATQKFSDNFNDAVSNADIKEKLHPATTGVVQEVQDRLAPQTDDDGNVIGPAQPLSFGELEYFKRRFQQASQTGVGSSDSGAANALRKNIIDFRNGLAPEDIDGDQAALQNVQNANASYRAGSQYEQLADLLTNSNGDINTFRNKLRSQLNNTKSDPFGGWAPEDVQTLRDFVDGSTVENVAGLLGKFGFDFKNPTSTANIVRGVAETGGSLMAPGVGIPLGVAGTVSKLGLNALKRGQLQGILSDLESRTRDPVPPSPMAPPPEPPTLPPSQLALPPPTLGIEGPRDIQVTPSGQATEVTSFQQQLANLIRNNRSDLGLTPDVQQNIHNQSPDVAGARALSPAYQAPTTLALPAPEQPTTLVGNNGALRPMTVEENAAATQARQLRAQLGLLRAQLGLSPDVQQVITLNDLSSIPNLGQAFKKLDPVHQEYVLEQLNAGFDNPQLPPGATWISGKAPVSADELEANNNAALVGTNKDIIDRVNLIRNPPAPPNFSGLLNYLKQKGGVQDVGGDVRSILGGANQYPGLVNSGGQTLDDAALAAQEAGYFPSKNLAQGDRATVNDLLDAIEKEHKTGKIAPSQKDVEASHDYAHNIGIADEMEQILGNHGLHAGMSDADIIKGLGLDHPYDPYLPIERYSKGGLLRSKYPPVSILPPPPQSLGTIGAQLQGAGNS